MSVQMWAGCKALSNGRVEEKRKSSRRRNLLLEIVLPWLVARALQPHRSRRHVWPFAFLFQLDVGQAAGSWSGPCPDAAQCHPVNKWHFGAVRCVTLKQRSISAAQ